MGDWAEDQTQLITTRKAEFMREDVMLTGAELMRYSLAIVVIIGVTELIDSSLRI
jgi:hypothetical protein